MNVQDIFLNVVRRDRVPVTIHLQNGEKRTGTIRSFDNFVLFLKHEGQELVYKHAIATIVPQRPVAEPRGVEPKASNIEDRPARAGNAEPGTGARPQERPKPGGS